MEVEHQICNAWLLESSHGQQAPPDVKGIGALLSLLVNKTLPIKIFPCLVSFTNVYFFHLYSIDTYQEKK